MSLRMDLWFSGFVILVVTLFLMLMCTRSVEAQVQPQPPLAPRTTLPPPLPRPDLELKPPAWVPEPNPQLVPGGGGRFVDGPPTVCPGGQWVGGRCQLLPGGGWVGRDR